VAKDFAKAIFTVQYLHCGAQRSRDRSNRAGEKASDEESEAKRKFLLLFDEHSFLVSLLGRVTPDFLRL